MLSIKTADLCTGLDKGTGVNIFSRGQNRVRCRIQTEYTIRCFHRSPNFPRAINSRFLFRESWGGFSVYLIHRVDDDHQTK